MCIGVGEQGGGDGNCYSLYNYYYDDYYDYCFAYDYDDYYDYYFVYDYDDYCDYCLVYYYGPNTISNSSLVFASLILCLFSPVVTAVT